MKPNTLEKILIFVSTAILLGSTPFLVFEHLFNNTDTQMLAKLWALRLHGFFAIVFVLGLGSLMRVHIPLSWRVGERRVGGVTSLVISVVLVLTGYWLYYGTEEFFRESARQIHIVAGLALPIALVIHAKYLVPVQRPGTKQKPE